MFGFVCVVSTRTVVDTTLCGYIGKEFQRTGATHTRD